MNTKEGVCNASQLSVKKIILSIFFLLVLCRTAGAQDSQKATLTAADGGTCSATSTACLVINVPSGSGGATFNIGANASANTVQFEATADYGTTWVALNVVPSNGTTAVTSTTSTGIWQANVAGYTKLRMRCSTFVGGTTTTYINLSTASARSNGGGGSVTHTAGNLTAFHLMLGNGLADSTVDSACLTNGTGALSGCTSISAGSGASAAGATATGGFAAVEAASTGWTPTAGQDYCRADSTVHNFVCALNGAAETPQPMWSAVPVGGKCAQTTGVAGFLVEASAACAGAPIFPVTLSGTVTSGGIPYFNSTTQESSSALLTSQHFMLGGGVGGAPTVSAISDVAGSASIAALIIPTDGAGNVMNITNSVDSNILVKISAAAAGTKYARIAQAQNEQLRFGQNNTENWMIDVGGHWRASTDNTYDIGAAAASRPKDLYLAGLMKNYGALTTAGMGVSPILGIIHSTALTAAVSTATLCGSAATACGVAGMYTIEWAFTQTGTACGTPGAGGVTFLLTWTDFNGTAHSAIGLAMDDSASLIATTGTFHFTNSNATAWASGQFNISSNGSIIQYATGYTACGVGTGSYELDISASRRQ